MAARVELGLIRDLLQAEVTDGVSFGANGELYAGVGRRVELGVRVEGVFEDWLGTNEAGSGLGVHAM